MIYTENTPNPNAVKFISEKTLSEVGVAEFQKINVKKIKNDFIKNLLEFDGVELVLVSENFISVKKNAKVNWDSLKPSIISLINDHFEKNKKPILPKTKDKNFSESKNKDKEKDLIVKKINEVLDSKIRPAVARDGGDIKFVSFKNGKVKVELRGSCSGCPSSIMTLKNGVQNLLRHYVKAVTDVEAI
tara:strand:- start:3448 stop:4011 length:564 start_codon:yes stop_codon:yes gene_type:complete